MRILVCGSRKQVSSDDGDTIGNALVCFGSGHVLIHGAATGVDTFAENVCAGIGWEVEAYPADWKRHGKAAGPMRNAEMLEKGSPELVLAFPNPHSNGTWDMVRKAVSAGIEVRIQAIGREA